jgi:hypothetical protein
MKAESEQCYRIRLLILDEVSMNLGLLHTAPRRLHSGTSIVNGRAATRIIKFEGHWTSGRVRSKGGSVGWVDCCSTEMLISAGSQQSSS